MVGEGSRITLAKPSESTGHTTQLRGMASMSHMRTAISPGKWRPWTADLTLLGLVSMA